MGKLPAFQFYPGDWIQDTRILTPATRGLWIDILCFMWRSETRGEISGSLAQLARILSCTEAECEAALTELNCTKCADVTFCNGDGNAFVTVKNRRMIREDKDRKSTRYRVKRFRKSNTKPDCNADSNANVTVPSSSSSSSSVKALTKVKAAEEPAALPEKLPLPGSKHFSSRLPDAEAVISKCRELQKLCINNNKFNPFQFVQQCAIKNKHPCAITDALDGLLKMWPDIDDPWPYANAIIKTKSGNYHEAEHKTQTEAFKAEWAKIAKQFFR